MKKLTILALAMAFFAAFALPGMAAPLTNTGSHAIQAHHGYGGPCGPYGPRGGHGC